jgi:hypothetical protein
MGVRSWCTRHSWVFRVVLPFLFLLGEYVLQQGVCLTSSTKSSFLFFFLNVKHFLTLH